MNIVVPGTDKLYSIDIIQTRVEFFFG